MQEQIIHAYKHNLIKLNYGDSHYNNKYHKKIIYEICKLLELNRSGLEISKMLNVPKSLINSIKYKKTWLNISKKYNIKDPIKQISYSKELKEKIKSLLIMKLKNKDIINLLNLNNTRATKEMINKIRKQINR
jgi:hypothetical protein